MGHPLCPHGQCRNSRGASIGPDGKGVRLKKRAGSAQSGGSGAVNGQQFQCKAAGGQVRDGGCGRSRRQKESVQGARLEPVTRQAGFDVLGDEISFLEAIGIEHLPGIDQCAGARFVQCHAFALQVRNGLDARALFHHNVNTFRVQVGNQTQAWEARFANKNTGAGVGPVTHISLAET